MLKFILIQFFLNLDYVQVTARKMSNGLSNFEHKSGWGETFGYHHENTDFSLFLPGHRYSVTISVATVLATRSTRR
jgi:hypothetical protein